MHSLGYGLKQGFKSLFRNRLFTLASIGTIIASLFIFGIFYCILANFQSMFTEVETSVGVTVFFDEGTTEERILEIKSQLEQQDTVDKVEYTSAEQAWEDYKNRVFPQGDDDILTNLDQDNPLANSASLTVYLTDTADQQQLVDYINQIDDVREVNSSDTVAQSVTSLGHMISYVSMIIIIILVAVAIFLISNTVMIGITVRKDEIAIMKYLGATDFFVRAPFLVEGLLIGLIGSIIPLIAIYFLYDRGVAFITTRFATISALFNFMPVMDILKVLVPASLAIGLGIGFIGSWFTLLKHVRV